MAEPKEQVYGKNVSDLQENIEFDGDKVKGILKYLEGYNEFEEGSEGNFLAIEIEEAKNLGRSQRRKKERRNSNVKQ